MNIHVPRRGFPAITLLVFLALPGRGFPGPREPEFRHLTVQDGLPHSHVQCLLKDRRGLMWFGTEDGLARYDGYSFRVYKHDPEDPGSISGDNISVLLEDRRGRLWAATLGGGLNLYDRNGDRFVRYPFPDPGDENLGFAFIHALIENHAGLLILGYDTGGVVIFNPDDGSRVQVKGSPDNPDGLAYNDVWALLEDDRNNIWIGTLGGGLDYYDTRTGRVVHYAHDPSNPASLSHNEVRCLLQDRRGDIWVGTSGGGLNRLDARTGRFVRYRYRPEDRGGLNDNVVFAMAEDREGTLWVGTETGGLNRYDAATRTFVSFRHDPAAPQSLSHDSVECLLAADDDLLWVGTYNGGVDVFDQIGKAFRTYGQGVTKTSLTNGVVLSFAEGPDGRVWIGTDGGGLNVLDRAAGTFGSFRRDPKNPRSLGDDVVQALLVDRRGRLWVGTYRGGLDRFDPRTGSFVHFRHAGANPASLADDDVRVIFEDRAGNLWVGMNKGGLDLFDGVAGFRHHRYDETGSGGLANDSVYSIFEDSRGTLWVGSFEGGLYAFDRARGVFRRYRHDDRDKNSLSDDRVFVIHEDGRGILWIGTGEGLNALDPGTGTFRRFGVKDGLPDDVVNGILEDRQGRLWLSTDGGLSRFDPGTATFRNYDRTDGLPNNQFKPGAALISRGGELFFGGINGFTVFDPGEIADNSHPPPVILTDFRIFNRSVPIGRGPDGRAILNASIAETREIVLSHRDDVISFEYAALDYRAPAKNSYAYMMAGFDETWTHAGTRRFTTYTNLPPGRYAFRVKAANNDGVWNEEGLSLAVRVTPPFYATWWFRGLALLAGLAALSGAYLARTRVLRARAWRLEERVALRTAELRTEIAERRKAEEAVKASLAEKEILLREIHHRVKNNMQVISSLLRLQSRTLQDPRAREALEECQSRIRSMSLVHESLYRSKDLSRIAFSEYLDTLVDHLRQAYRITGDRIRLNVRAEAVTMNINTAIPCGLIITELISNALKHAFPGERSGTILVRLEMADPKTYRLTIRDDGVGLPAGLDIRETETLGLQIIITLAEQLDGKMDLRSDGGTVFEMTFQEQAGS